MSSVRSEVAKESAGTQLHKKSEIVSDQFLDELKNFWEDRHGTLIEPSHNALILKLRGELTDAEFQETCQQLLKELIKILESQTGQEYFRNDNNPFYQPARFVVAINQLKSTLASFNPGESCEAKIVMAFRTINFLDGNYRGYSFTDELIPQNVTRYIASLLKYVYCDSAYQDLMRNINGIFSSITGIDHKGDNFIKIFNRYIESPLNKELDAQILRLNRVYNNRAWESKDLDVRQHHENFIDALINLRKMYIASSAYGDATSQLDLIIRRTASMLKELKRGNSDENKKYNIAVIDDYQQFCKKELGNNNKFAYFMKAIGAIILTGLTYISGVGAIRAFRSGKNPVDSAKETCGLNPKYSLSHYLTFKPVKILLKAEETAELARVEAENISKGWQILKN